MSQRAVTTQAELDAALKAGVDYIDIRSECGVWLHVAASGSATVRASGSATVRAYGSATVRASDSATVRAYGSATVRASDSATVTAYDSATVRATDSATVTASDSATVTAYDSATVRAYDSATVTATGSATVTAGKYVAVHLSSQHVTLDGGVLIDMTAIDAADPQTWCDLKGAAVKDGRVTVYKAVDADLHAGHDHRLTIYPIGENVECPDWDARARCGSGLHFSPDPTLARRYYSGASAPRFLEVTVALADMVPLDDKIKAPSCVVVREVDEWCRPVEQVAS